MAGTCVLLAAAALDVALGVELTPIKLEDASDAVLLDATAVAVLTAPVTIELVSTWSLTTLGVLDAAARAFDSRGAELLAASARG